jgi:hypothetical protein
MSPDQFFVKYSAPLLALVMLVGFSAFLNQFNPKNDIIRRLGDDYFSTDQTWFYRPQQLFDMLDKYAPEDREAHVQFIYLDLVYPVIYSLTAAILLASLLPILLPALQARCPYLSLLPVAAAIFDYLENLSMLWIVRRYSANYRPAGLALFSSAMTTFKLLLLSAMMLLLAAILFALVYQVLRAVRK